jgi:predicted nucleotidyltransferase
MSDNRILEFQDRKKLERLGEELGALPLDLAVVFGSQVKSNSTKMSDLDLAVKFKPDLPQKEKFKIMDKITAIATNRTGFESIDLVDLERVGPGIGYRALKEGKLITGSDEKATNVQARLLLQKLDFAPVKEEWREAMTERIEKGEYGKRQ